MSDTIDRPAAARRIPRGLTAREYLRQEILAELAADGDPQAEDAERVRRAIKHQIDRYTEAANRGLFPPLAVPQRAQLQLELGFLRAGPFTKYFDHEVAVDEVLVSGNTISAITSEGRVEVDGESVSVEELTAIVTRLLADVGVAIDTSRPSVVTQIWNNTVRASVSIPPIASTLDGSFRIYRPRRTTLADLIELDSLSAPAANFLAATMLIDAGTLVSGAPGAGKTTLMSALLKALPPTTICRVIQEAREVDVEHLLGGCWSPVGGGHSIRSLVALALQFATTYLVVAETRGAEAYELVKAANSGCGFMTTLHAKSGAEAMDSLVSAALMAGENVPAVGIRSAFSRLIDVVVHCEAEPVHRLEPGDVRRRQVVEISMVPAQLSNDQFALEPLFRREQMGAPMTFAGVGALGPIADELDRALPAGVTAQGLCEGTVRLL